MACIPGYGRHALPLVAILLLILAYRLYRRDSIHTGHSQDVTGMVTESVALTQISKHLLSPARNNGTTHIPEDVFRGLFMPAKKAGAIPSQVYSQPALNPHLAPLFGCPRKPIRFTQHIRVPYPVYNISMIPSGGHDVRRYWNPTIMPLPSWSKNQYLVVSRVLTTGTYQENVLCEANICAPASLNTTSSLTACSEDDLLHLGGTMGLRCATPPIRLNVPPTPAKKCKGEYEAYVDIPGFHDPRIFWSGKGEPLMIMGSQSQYACFGLWIQDLRTLYPPLQHLLSPTPGHPPIRIPPISYLNPTELTLNPPSSRSAFEKNWLLFSPPGSEKTYIQHNLSPSHGRTLAQTLGNGFTTPNLTDPHEPNCLAAHDLLGRPDDGMPRTKPASWHQATNAIHLLLCERDSPNCTASASAEAEAGKSVFVALIHRKISNGFNLPLRYERYAVVWSATPPFALLAVGKYPLLFANETASGWSAGQNWDAGDEGGYGYGSTTETEKETQRNGNKRGKGMGKENGMGKEKEKEKEKSNKKQEEAMWSPFTYTVSLSWSHRPASASHTPSPISKPEPETEIEPNFHSLHTMHSGTLSDTVIVGVGVEDGGQVFAELPVRELLLCLRPCQGRGGEGEGRWRAGT